MSAIIGVINGGQGYNYYEQGGYYYPSQPQVIQVVKEIRKFPGFPSYPGMLMTLDYNIHELLQINKICFIGPAGVYQTGGYNYTSGGAYNQFGSDGSYKGQYGYDDGSYKGQYGSEGSYKGQYGSDGSYKGQYGNDGSYNGQFGSGGYYQSQFGSGKLKQIQIDVPIIILYF